MPQQGPPPRRPAGLPEPGPAGPGPADSGRAGLGPAAPGPARPSPAGPGRAGLGPAGPSVPEYGVPEYGVPEYGVPEYGWRERPARRRGTGRRGPDRSDDPGQDLDQALDQDVPPWAGLGISPRRPPRGGDESPRPPAAAEPTPADPADPAVPRTRRAVATRARKARRRIYASGGAAIAVAVIAAAGWHVFGPKAAAPRPGGFVTTYQPGDFRSVPDACQAVSAGTLNQYLPGTRSRAVSALGGSRTESQCTWTLDAKPRYQVLEVTAQSYPPSLLATGDGSATYNAIDSYGQTRQGLASPARATHLPKATVTPVTGLGDRAFSALQVINAGGDTMDLVTLVVRDHNALITVTMQGLDHSARGGYGPVSISLLRAGATAAAREVLARLG